MQRRRFLASSVGIAAQPLIGLMMRDVWAQGAPTPRPRQRLEDFAKNVAWLDALKRGVTVMRARDPSDPTSWFFQGAMHSVSREAVEEARKRDPKVAGVERFWKKCPHGDQYNSADFLIWHRAYIYYFERILRAATGDPQFSLPYWNYTDPQRRTFPAEFGNPLRDPDGKPTNPLWDPRREQAFMSQLYELNENAVGIQNLVGEINFFGETEISGLAGGVADSNGRTRGLIERRPHDMVHFAIGGVIGTDGQNEDAAVGGLMADVDTAAFDPVFWIHHSNIDRLWTTWECLSPARQWGFVPPQEWLDATPWEFHDFDKSIQKQSRLYYLKRTNLAVTYDTDTTACRPLSATVPKPPKEPGGGKAGPLNVTPAIRSFVVKAEAGKQEVRGRIAPVGAHEVTVALNTMPEMGGRRPGIEILAAGGPAAPRRLMLELSGLEVEGVTSSGFDVFVNARPGERDRSSPTFVGSISLFGLTGAHASHGQNTQVFDITALARLPGWDSNRLRVSIVAFDLLVPKQGQKPLRRKAGIKYSGVRVIVYEGSSAPVM